MWELAGPDRYSHDYTDSSRVHYFAYRPLDLKNGPGQITVLISLRESHRQLFLSLSLWLLFRACQSWVPAEV